MSVVVWKGWIFHKTAESSNDGEDLSLHAVDWLSEALTMNG